MLKRLNMNHMLTLKMVLSSGIEPPTSSLPMKCSTPELRQRTKFYWHIEIAMSISNLNYTQKDDKFIFCNR